jgi:putative transposase
LEAAIEQIDNAYSNFFNGKAGFPKFVSKYTTRGNSYTTKFSNNNIEFLLNENDVPCIKLPKVGKVPFVLPKGMTIEDICPIGTHITRATVRHIGKRYFVSVAFETVIDEIIPVREFSPAEVFGCDVGLKHFCHYGSLDDKYVVDNPRYIKLHERRLRRLQKSLSRKVYDVKTHTGSKNYYKAKERLRREHEKIRNQRRDFHHKLSREIADSCKVFVCEDLNIRGMMKNRHLSNAIASVGWYQFLTYVKYKLERKGGIFIKADRWFASSQTCSACGYRNPDVKDLSVRSWVCPECGTVHDRDDNAVDNLIAYAIDNWQELKALA